MSHSNDIQIEDVSHAPGSSCGCGGNGHEPVELADGAYPDPGGALVLDARVIPHAHRHATVFGSLAETEAGDALVLVAPHDPLPMLAQLEQREPGQFSVSYEVKGPDYWRLRLVRDGQ